MATTKRVRKHFLLDVAKLKRAEGSGSEDGNGND